MQEFSYRIIYSARRSIGIIVSPQDGVVVRAPSRMSRQRIDSFISEKSEWIKKHLSKHQELIRINHEKKYEEGEEHYFMGKKYKLAIVKDSKTSVVLKDDYIRIGIKDLSDKIKVKALLDRWYTLNARDHFTRLMEMVLEEYKEYDFRPKKIIIRASKSRWGSCSSSGIISISSELIKLEERFYEYIFLHELCHLKHHNHGSGFYKLLETVKPDYREVRKELRKYVMK
jgi:predicted metal-dependent hydrolase